MMTKIVLIIFAALCVPLGQLEVNNLTGFGAGGGPTINLAVGSSENDYNVCTKIQATGIDPAVVTDGKAVITLADSVIVGSTSASTAAMLTGDCGSAWAYGWTVDVVVGDGDSARIQGKGGAGGAGATRGVIIEGCDSIGTAGGGGGGAGTQVGAGANANGSDGTATAGGSGGTNTLGTCTVSGASAGSTGGDALEATDAGPDVFLLPGTGSTLEVWAGGGGGGGSANGTGGDGGDPGASGDSAGAAGGSAGTALSTPGSATITEGGAGTVDDLGA